jgi:hypothetical protein
MKRLATLALTLAFALPACAQRGGGHASFASHSAPSFHGPSFSGAPAFRGNYAPTPYRYAGGPLASRPYYTASNHAVSPMTRFAPVVSAARPSFYQKNRTYTVTHHVSVHGWSLNSYPNSVYGYLPYTGFVDSPNYDDSSAYAPESAPQPEPDTAYAEPAPFPSSEYAPGPPAPASAPQAALQPAPEPEDAVTLIFKDGRPAEQIHNYLATRTTITAIDGRHRRDISVSDLDIPATIEANRSAGVDFQLPGQ